MALYIKDNQTFELITPKVYEDLQHVGSSYGFYGSPEVGAFVCHTGCGYDRFALICTKDELDVCKETLDEQIERATMISRYENKRKGSGYNDDGGDAPEYIRLHELDTPTKSDDFER